MNIIRSNPFNNICMRASLSTKISEFNPISTIVLKADLKVFVTSPTFPADLLMVDLQDGVPISRKPAVRKLISHAFDANSFKDSRVVVRINELSKPQELAEDLLALSNHIRKIFGFVLPMIKTPGDVYHYEEMIQNMASKVGETNNYYLFPIIETQHAVENVSTIAKASASIAGMFFGDADLTVALGIKKSATNLLYARQKFVNAATAEGIYPIDGAHTKLDDNIGLETECFASKNMGFFGKTALHPKQLPTINKIFSSSKKELDWARNVIETISNGLSTYRENDQSSRDFFGPPHLKLAEKILNGSKKIQTISIGNGIKPTFIKGGFDLNIHRLGIPIDCEFELSVTDGILAQWDGLIFNSRRIGSSSNFAKELGFSDRIVHNSLLMTLTASLAVSQFSETAKVHLSFENAKYLRPVFPGDSLKGNFVVISVKDSKSGKGSIVRSHHYLQNQYGENVYQVDKLTLFPSLGYERSFDNFENRNLTSSPFYEQIISLNVGNISSNILKTVYPKHQYRAGDLIIHRFVKVFGKSEVRSLCNIIRATNSHHHDHIMFNREEILVPGPFVTHSSLGCAGLDFGEVLFEQIHRSDSLAKVNHEDVICAMTYVKSVESVPSNSNLENLHLVTVGLKNIDINALSEEVIPFDIFNSVNYHSSKIEKICIEKIPLLLNRIVSKTEYTLTRIS